MNKSIANELNLKSNKRKMDIKSVFIEPIVVGECPLCGAETYSENDPSNDPTMAVMCCECRWWENQFLTWDDIQDIEVEPIEDIEDEVYFNTESIDVQETVKALLNNFDYKEIDLNSPLCESKR